MATSKATTVAQYLDELPDDRRASIARVRDTVLAHLPPGYSETMGYGMISWGIPLDVYPDTYNGQPLCYAALASQKNYMTLYLMGAYADAKQRARLEEWYARNGKRLDMGKSCLHFRRADELPLELIGELIAQRSPNDFITLTESTRKQKPSAVSLQPSAKKKKTRKGRRPKAEG